MGSFFVLLHHDTSSGVCYPLIRRFAPPSPQGEGYHGIIFFALMYRSSSEKTQPQYFCI